MLIFPPCNLWYIEKQHLKSSIFCPGKLSYFFPDWLVLIFYPLSFQWHKMSAGVHLVWFFFFFFASITCSILSFTTNFLYISVMPSPCSTGGDLDTPRQLLPKHSHGQLFFRSSLGACVLSHVQLCAAAWTVAYSAPPSLEFSRWEHWTGLPLPTSGDLPNPGIKLTSLVSPVLTSRFVTTSATWEVFMVIQVSL